MVSKWCEMGFVHPQYFNGYRPTLRTPASCEGKSNCCCSYVSGNVALPVMVQAKRAGEPS